MTTLKQLLTCDVYDENEIRLGQVRDVAYDKNGGKCLPILDDKVYTVDKLAQSCKSLVASNAQQTANTFPTITNKTAYDTSGNRLGVVADATIGKTMTIGKIILEDGRQYSRGRIAAVNDIVLIKPSKPKAAKEKKRKAAQTSICANEQPAPKSTQTAVCTQAAKRRYGDFSFLLGKTADKIITNFFGEVMIRAGETVTQDVLRQAKLGGKLIELCLHVK